MIDKKLFALLGPHKKYIFYSVAFMLLGLVCNITITATMIYIIQLASEYKIHNTIHIFILPLLIILVAMFVRYKTSCTIGDLKDRLGGNVKKDLREKVYQKILNLGVRSSDEMSMAGLTQVSLEGIEQLDLYYSSYIPQFFYALLAPIILFFISVWIDVKVALVLLLCVPLIPLSIVAVSKYAKKIFAKYWNKYTSMGDDFLDALQGLKELKIFKADQRQHKKMNESSEEFRVVTMKVLTMQLASTTIMDLVAYGGAGLGIALSLYSYLQGSLSLYEVLFLILIAVDFFLPLRAFGSAFHIAMNGASAGNKILSLLETKEATWGNKEVDNFDIRLENITFSYDFKRNVLEDVSLSFKGNGMIGIVGESGCGKSTLVNLISGALKAQKGEIWIGEHKIEELNRSNYYSHLAMISYNTYLFNESIFDNFRLAKNDVSEEEIYEALKKVNLYDFIMEHGGLDKLLLEDAANISGGQRQRLALAINLVSDKELYIFDEATSNIDIESEAIILSNILKLSQDKKVIVISHRLENVTKADKIYFMKDGHIKEEGKHETLMLLNQEYAHLYRSQKKLEEAYKDE